MVDGFLLWYRSAISLILWVMAKRKPQPKAKPQLQPKIDVRESLLQQPWQLITWMALLGVLWSVVQIAGLTDGWSEVVTVTIWMSIRALWILLVVFRWVGDPIWTMVLTSGLYGWASVIPQQIHWDDTGASRIVTAVATIVTSVIFGFLLGIIAKLFQRIHTNR